MENTSRVSFLSSSTSSRLQVQDSQKATPLPESDWLVCDITVATEQTNHLSDLVIRGANLQHNDFVQTFVVSRGSALTDAYLDMTDSLLLQTSTTRQTRVKRSSALNTGRK